MAWPTNGFYGTCPRCGEEHLCRFADNIHVCPHCGKEWPEECVRERERDKEQAFILLSIAILAVLVVIEVALR